VQEIDWEDESGSGGGGRVGGLGWIEWGREGIDGGWKGGDTCRWGWIAAWGQKS